MSTITRTLGNIRRIGLKVALLAPLLLESLLTRSIAGILAPTSGTSCPVRSAAGFQMTTDRGLSTIVHWYDAHRRHTVMP